MDNILRGLNTVCISFLSMHTTAAVPVGVLYTRCIYLILVFNTFTTDGQKKEMSVSETPVDSYQVGILKYGR